MAANQLSRQQRLLRLYASHPQNAAAILARLGDSRSGSFSADDFARDPHAEVTDQNHIGGLEALADTARLARLQSSDRVLDIGSGLGGSARILAYRHGCRVDGIDLSPERCRDARRLTALAALDDRVAFVCGDILTADLPADCYDVILGQGVFIHFEDRRPVLARCASLLASAGRLLIEDCYLVRPPRDAAEARLVGDLSRCWLGRFDPLAKWRSDLAAAGLGERAIENETPLLVRYFQRLLALSPPPAGDAALDYEMGGWRQAVALAEAGLLGYFRLLAAAGG